MKTSESFCAFVMSLGMVGMFYFQADTFRMMMIEFGNDGQALFGWLSAAAWIGFTAAGLSSLFMAWLMWKRGPGK